jgi:dienelactone hydrolase
MSFTTWNAVLLTTLTTAMACADDYPPVDRLPEVNGLPDVLRMFDGTPVTTRDQWLNERRPELRRLFQHYMYGYFPPTPTIAAKVTQTKTGLSGGAVTLQEVEIRFVDLPENAPRIRLALFLPAKAAGPSPVFLALNSCGNQEVLEDPAITVDEAAWRREHCTPPVRGSAKDFWCVDYLASRGYAFATFHESDVDPDKHDFSDGIHPFYAHLPIPQKSRPGTIAAWAWGLHRAVDYLATDPQIDRSRICLIGHSRRGKTALLAAAMDDRVALVVPHQSGTGGMALSRDSQQETVERINRVFPHWFNDQFKEFNEQVNRLPFDQHALVALVAPRPLLDTEGAQDAWANFPRALDALKGADPVYKLLGKPGLVGTGLVQDEEPIAGPNLGTILQCRLNQKHTLNRTYWERILDFADAQLGGSAE